MGSAFGKDAADATTGLTDKEKRYIRNVWYTFTVQHEDYGVILFTSLFVKHPEYQQLFSNFRDKQLSTLKGDPKFRAHASIVGEHITSMVNALDSPQVLVGVVEKNARFHVQLGNGVVPEHFVEFGRVIIEVLSANYEQLMTPAAVAAWKKLFGLMNEKNVAVYAAEPSDANTANAYKLQGMSTTAILAKGILSAQSPVPPRRASHAPAKIGEKPPRLAKAHDAEAPTSSSGGERSPANVEQPKDKGQYRKVASKPETSTAEAGPSAATNGAAQGPPQQVSPSDKERHKKSAASAKTQPGAHKTGQHAAAEGADHKQPPGHSAKGKEATGKSKTSEKSSHGKQDTRNG